MRGFRIGAVCAALLLVAGAAFAQGFRGGGGGFGRTGMLSIPEVQRELRLDEAQIDLLKQLGMEMQQRSRQLFQDFQSLAPEERGRRMAEFRTQQDKKVAEILEPKQLARLRQLEVQQEGLRALGRKDMADDLKLTADQRQRVQGALDGERDAMRLMFQDFRPGGQTMTPEQREEVRRKFGEVRTATDSKLGAILAEPQKKQFQVMQGTPFKFPERRLGRPGGN